MSAPGNDQAGDDPVDGSPDRAAVELADRYWDEVLEHEPVFATQVGDPRYDDRMPDPTEAGRERRRATHVRALEELGRLDREALGEIPRTTMHVLETFATNELHALRLRTDRLFSVSHILGPGQILATLGSIQPAGSPEEVDRYVARLSAIPAYLRGLGEVAADGVRTGVTVPAVVIDRTIAQVERLLALDPAESPGMTPLGPDPAPADRDRVEAALREHVWPGYAEYLETLRWSRPSARDSIGVSDVPGGEEIYEAAVEEWTTLPMTAKDVHELGVEQLAATEEERQEIARSLGFADAESALAAHREAGRDTVATREDLVRLAQEQVGRSWEAAPRAFGRLPRIECEVRAVEEFREKDTPAAFYMAPPGDASRPGIYYVNAYEVQQRPRHALASITFHEANPGHHFQLTIEQEIEGRPALRRFGGLLVGHSFVEGWGLYSERLADELGLYEDDYERLGMLGAQGWRAARLVVDTGMHAFGWDRERAIELMQKATDGPRVEAEIEIDRYIAWPGQALAYKVGQLEIERLRAELVGGDGFALRDFHDRLLGLGSLPLIALRRELQGDG